VCECEREKRGIAAIVRRLTTEWCLDRGDDGTFVQLHSKVTWDLLLSSFQLSWLLQADIRQNVLLIIPSRRELSITDTSPTLPHDELSLLSGTTYFKHTQYYCQLNNRQCSIFTDT